MIYFDLVKIVISSGSPSCRHIPLVCHLYIWSFFFHFYHIIFHICWQPPITFLIWDFRCSPTLSTDVFWYNWLTGLIYFLTCNYELVTRISGGRESLCLRSDFNFRPQSLSYWSTHESFASNYELNSEYGNVPHKAYLIKMIWVWWFYNLEYSRHLVCLDCVLHYKFPAIYW